MKKRESRSKISLVVGIEPQNYRVPEPRLNKPVCFKKIEGDTEIGSMLVQDLEETIISGTRFTYFTPNNIAILLSISNKSLAKAKNIFSEKLDPHKVNLALQNAGINKADFLNKKSSEVCDYIESIQTSITFAYTALETFANLSIPEDHIYEVKVKTKGTKELYDKEAIERWVTFRDKLLYVLPDVYECKKPDKEKSWSYFIKLEKYRHAIIHQKSINSTEFYKTYFRRDIFDVCNSAEKIIHFFYKQNAEKNRTIPLWPWMINSENYFPVTYSFESQNFEVIGNLYEGYKRRK